MDFGFSNIEITNFRGIDHLEIGGLAPVNVFVGANNVGKTSVLEAVFMLSGLSNPQMPTRVNYLRSVLQDSVDSARYLFHNLDFGNRPLLKAGAEGGDRWLTFAPVMVDSTEASAGLSFTHTEIARLDFDFGVGGGRQYHASLSSADDGKIKQTRPEDYAEKIRCLFIPADKNDKNAAANFSTLVKRNGRQPVVDALRDFDPAIESVEALPDGLYLKLAGVGELLPVSMAGDGVRRAVNILSVVANEDYNMVLVDEFDTGLHYTAHKKMWRAVLGLAKRRGVQLFVTTHNLDCILGLKSAMDDNETLRPMVNVYDIVRTKCNGYRSYCYSYDGLRECDFADAESSNQSFFWIPRRSAE